MEHNNVILLGGITLAVIVTLYLLWGPSPRPKKRKGDIVGLVNFGTTCFMNTLLQALASCALFVEWLDQQSNDERVLTSTLQRVLWILNGESETATHSPDELISALKRHGWVLPPGEQDAHELFHCIISTLQEENKKIRPAGSLSDALPLSDTLSQASDILEEDPFDATIAVEANTSSVKDDKSDNISVKTALTIYEDAAATLKEGDSDSTSLGAQDFYSIDSNGSKGDGSDETLKLFHSPKESDLAKQALDHLRSSPESIRRGLCDRSGSSSPASFGAAESPPFQGLLASSVQCAVCGNSSSIRTDTFDSLSLTLGESNIARHKLVDLLRQFVRTEIIPDVQCDKCAKKTHAFKTYNFGKLPPCLCLHIARTSWLSSSRTSSKRDDHVDFPEYLVMDPFTWRPAAANGDAPPAISAKYLYRLKSVVVHVGSASSGHFLTFRRGPLISNQRHRKKGKTEKCMDSERWFMASDEVVRLSSMKIAMDSLAYILFYERCSTQVLAHMSADNQLLQ